LNLGIANIYDEIAPGRLLVQFKPEYRDAINIEFVDGKPITPFPVVNQLNEKWRVYQFEKLNKEPNPTELAKQFGMDLIYLLLFPETYDVLSIKEEYYQTGFFEYVEPDLIRKADVVPRDPDLIPNDPLFSGQWHLTKIKCPTAWDSFHGDSSVTALIIDCGVDYLHEDLTWTYAVNPAEDINHNGRFDPTPASSGGDLDGIDQDYNGYADDVIGYNFLNGNANPFPPAGDDHGTECVGVFCAHTNNGAGVAGITWGCRYVIARVGTGGSIYTSYAIQALNYAVSRNVWAINMSYGGSYYNSLENNAIQYCWSAGIVLAASAGNQFSNFQPRYPACYPNVIAVAASDAQDLRSNWGGGYESNYAPWVDVTAPGTQVLTTDIFTNAYGAFDGTSFSAPCVVGEALLLKSVYPSMTNAQCTTRIFQSCDSMPDPQYVAGNLGRGRINVAKAVLQPIRCNLRTVSFRLNDGNNNYPQPGEYIALITTMTNEINYQPATNVSATLTCSDPAIVITKNTATFPTINPGGSANCSADSFVFTVVPNAIPHRVRFEITINATPPSIRTADTIYMNVCLPRILLVDDDNGADYERWYKQAIDSLKTIYAVWTVATAGSPPLDTLLQYPVVVWFTGLDSLNTLTSTDQTNLTSYLNQGKNLFICGQNIGQNIGTTPFYSNYLHAEYVVSHTGTLYSVGIPNDPIGGVNGDTIVTGGAGGASNATSCDGIRPISGAYPCFRYRNYPDTTVYGVIRYNGTYKVVYFGLPFEAIDHTVGRYIQKWDVMRRILEYFNEPLPGVEQEITDLKFTSDKLQIYPNPFINQTNIRLLLPAIKGSKLNIYNATGTVVKTMSVDSPLIIWDGTNQEGKKLTNGVYFVELKTPNGSLTKKALILR
ncbi:MAG: S8 family serine peptidase, partial [candidate division WOR-3 bacterium]